MTTLTELYTPCGTLKCVDQNNNIIPFRSIPLDSHYKTAVYDEIQSDWIPVLPEHQSTIAVDMDTLKIGETYIIRLYGDFEYQFGASDEYAIANVITHDNYSLSLGAYDPNDNGKDRQWVRVYDKGVCIGAKPPEQYDTSNFHGYLLGVLPDWSGFSFRLIDHTLPEILFRIVWIKHNDDLIAEIDDYENAVSGIATF